MPSTKPANSAGNAAGPRRVAGPLSGVLILDLTRVLAGPFCTMVLADLGARVVKVEPPNGDDARAYGPFLDDEETQSGYFASLNRGKESIALDLKSNADKRIFDRLVERADVIIENFRPGTMERLGYGWDSLHARHPRLIYASASGFGHTGPYARRPAYDMVVQGMGGIMSITGEPGRPPVRVGSSIGDITAGLFTAIGITAALTHRHATGEAIKVDVAMLDCQVAILENAIARYAATGEVAGPLGTRHPSISPFGAFAARDGRIIIAAGNDILFAELCEAIGQTRLARDPRFRTNALRCLNWEPLFAGLEVGLAAHDVSHWLSALEDAGIPCGPINTVADVLANPQVRSRNMVVTAEDPDTGPLLMAGNPIKLSSFVDPATRTPAPRLDGNRASLLAEIASPSAGANALVPVAAKSGPGTGPASGAPSRASSAARLLEYLAHAIGVEPRIAIPRDGTFRDRAKGLCDALMSERGEVLGTAIAGDLVALVNAANADERRVFFSLLARFYNADPLRISRAAERWRTDNSPAAYAELMGAVEPPRQELFRRMNMGDDGTATLVRMRQHLIAACATDPTLLPVDHDLKHLLGSWFNRGFLRLERISWHTPAFVLEKLMAYEAVHPIDGWADLRRRLGPDRRCYGFFHPALPDEPIIFVEVALLDHMAERIEPIIRAPMPETASEPGHADTAIFYSISNCQPGLKGISFGNFLIKQVAADLQGELASLETFATLSPMPRFRAWLEDKATDLGPHLPPSLIEKIARETGHKDLRAGIELLARAGEAEGYSRSGLLRDCLLRLGARFLSGTGSANGVTDPVARFHLGNGAAIERVNWMADLSPSGRAQSHGLMVNYLYDLDALARNHEAFANGQPVATSRAIATLIDTAETDMLGLRTRRRPETTGPKSDSEA